MTEEEVFKTPAEKAAARLVIGYLREHSRSEHKISRTDFLKYWQSLPVSRGLTPFNGAEKAAETGFEALTKAGLLTMEGGNYVITKQTITWLNNLEPLRLTESDIEALPQTSWHIFGQVPPGRPTPLPGDRDEVVDPPTIRRLIGELKEGLRNREYELTEIDATEGKRAIKCLGPGYDVTITITLEDDTASR